MPVGTVLPESIVFTFAHNLETVLRHPANQILRQGLVVRNLQGTLGGFVFFQFLLKWLQPRRHWREVEMGLVRGESEQEPGFHEKWRAPLDRFLGLRRDALEKFVQPAQMRLTLQRSRANIVVDCFGTLGCHRFYLHYGSFNPLPSRMSGMHFSTLDSRVLACFGAEKCRM